MGGCAWRWRVAVVLAALATAAGAQVTLDGSLGPAGALPGPDYVIGSELGRQVGGNLFHSFGRFGIRTGESATFTHSGAVPVGNIIGRVTGGEISAIDGLVASSIPGANLYLINPAGVVFGPDAALDIGGSFYASTADYIALDGTRFSARDPGANPVLSSAPPAAFGFLGQSPASLQVDRSVLVVPAGEELGLVAGGITITGGPLGFLRASGGAIALVSVASPGEVRGSLTAPDLAGFSTFGPVRIGDQAVLQVDGPRAGGIVIRGGEFRLEGFSVLDAETLGAGPGGLVDVVVGDAQGLAGDLVIGEGSLIRARSFGAGPAGDIRLLGGRVEISGGAEVTANAEAAGAGGNVLIGAAETLSIRGADAAGNATAVRGNTLAAGRGGSVHLQAPAVLMDGGLVQVLSAGDGAAGSLRVVAGELVLRHGAQLDISARAAGAGGTMLIEVGSLLIEGSRADAFLTGLFNNAFGSGAAGNLSVRGRELVVDGGTILASTLEDGAAGGIELRVEELTVRNEGRITLDTAGAGAGGFLTVTASGSIRIVDPDPRGALTGIFSESTGSGDAGVLDLTAADLILDGGRIAASSSGSGDAGAVGVTAERIRLVNGGQIEASTSGSGAGGLVSVNASESLEVIGRDALGTFSAVLSNASGLGGPGALEINGGDLTIDDALVQALTTGSGDAGGIFIDARSLTIVNGGQIDSSSRGTGNGGVLRVQLDEDLRISGRDGDGFRSGLFTNTLDTGEGGVLSVTAREVVLDDAEISATSSGAGPAGGILVEAERISLINGGQITADTFDAGEGGFIGLTVGESLRIAGHAADGTLSGLFTNTSGSGDSGLLGVFGGQVVVDDGVIQALTSGEGDAFGLLLEVASLTLVNGGQVDSSTRGAGNAGTVVIDLAGDLLAQGADVAGNPSGLFSNALGAGSGGNVIVEAQRVVLSGGGTISSASAGGGLAGNVAVTARADLQVLDGASLSTEAQISDGGEIRVTARDLVYVRDARITATVASGEGAGGNIRIDPTFVVLDDGQVIANAFGGPGGNIRIAADFFFASAGSVVSASSALGIAGTVVIDAPQPDISGAVVALPASFLDATALLREPCAARQPGSASSFVVTGRGALPVDPEDPLAVTPLDLQPTPAGAGLAADRPLYLASSAGAALWRFGAGCRP